MARYEKNLLSQATHRGYRFDGNRQLADFELLAKLRHHGAATRLVDFSRSLLVGLWFASSENSEEPGLLIGFDTWHLAGYEKELEIRTYDRVVEDLSETTPATWEPPSVSPRVAVQHSQFIYSRVVMNGRGSLCFPERENYRLFEITPNLKKESLAILTEVFDISRGILFPDLDGFSESNSSEFDIHGMQRW